MRAYNLGMGMIFINCGFAIVFSLDIFGSQFETHSAVWDALRVIATLEFAIPGTDISFPGIAGFAIAIAGASSFIGSKVVSTSGVAIVMFAVLFWGSFGLAFTVLTQIPLPGIGLFLTIFLVAALLIFSNAIIQMPTGGQRSHV